MAFVVFVGTFGISLSPIATAGVQNNLESTADRAECRDVCSHNNLLPRLSVQCSADGGV